MPLLSICTRVADAIGLPRPTQIASSTDQLGRQMLSLINDVMDDLAGMPWPCLQAQYVFSTVPNQVSYTLPSDWDRNVSNTAYIVSNDFPIRGAVSSSEWARLTNGGQSANLGFTYRMSGFPLAIQLTPTPVDVQTLTIEYVSKNLVKSAEGIGMEYFTQDNDVPIFPEELVRKGLRWRIRHAKGLEYGEDFNAYEMSKSLLIAQQLNLGMTPVAYRHGIDGGVVTDGYVREQGFGV